MRDLRVSVLKFVEETMNISFNPNQKFLRWGSQNELPSQYLELYYTIPEHTSSINFILNNVIIDDYNDQLDYWMLQKLGLDYLIFGGFAVEIIKQRGGGFKLNYLDISKCRYNPEKTQIGYSEDWNKYKVKVSWKKISTSVLQEGIFIFKNPKSRDLYPTPHYFSAFKSLDTMKTISEYHNNTAKGGFAPTVVINFNDSADVSDETKDKVEEQIKDKFTGSTGQKFILSFNDSKDKAVTIEQLSQDNLDTKFETLQKFIQNQIIISHQITSGQLIGVKPENTGFSKTEYDESLDVFMDNVIEPFIKEMEYGLSMLLNEDVVLIRKEDVETNNDIDTDNDNNDTPGMIDDTEDDNVYSRSNPTGQNQTNRR